VIIPPMTNQYLNLTKNSSLAVADRYPDVVSIANTAINNRPARRRVHRRSSWPSYLNHSLTTSAIMNWYNKRAAIKERMNMRLLAFVPARAPAARKPGVLTPVARVHVRRVAARTRERSFHERRLRADPAPRGAGQAGRPHRVGAAEPFADWKSALATIVVVGWRWSTCRGWRLGDLPGDLRAGMPMSASRHAALARAGA